MRLPKNALVKGQAEIIDYDDFGRPIYGDASAINFKMDIEPFGQKLAELQYGVFVDVQYRIFSKPNQNIKLNAEISYKDKSFIVTKILDYDKHYEILVKEVDKR